MADLTREHLRQADDMTPAEHYEAARLLAEGYSTDAPVATRYRDIDPVPTTGGAVPHAQPGRPPMSQRATDHSALVLSYSVASLPVGGATSLVLWALSSVSPTTLAIAGLAAAGFVITVGITARMMGRAVREGASALPDNTQHHHTHIGPTYLQHNQLHTQTRGFGRTTNQLPPRH